MQVQQGEQMVSCAEATGCICHWAKGGFSVAILTPNKRLEALEPAWFESFEWSWAGGNGHDGKGPR